jgi:hypothetical protein
MRANTGKFAADHLILPSRNEAVLAGGRHKSCLFQGITVE